MEYGRYIYFRLYPFRPVRVLADRETFHRLTPFVFVGIEISEMENLSIRRRERLDRGLVSVYVTNRTGRWGLVRLALRALLGRLHGEKDFLALPTNEVTIE